MNNLSNDDAMIVVAADSGNLEFLKRLAVEFGVIDFRRKCDFVNDCQGKRALHCAAENGFLHICKFLVQEVKVNINIKSDIGNTPLLNAVAIGHNIITAKYLITRGADINMADSKGMTCLHYAAEKDNMELMQMLMLRGADIESNSVCGTPLQCAASRGNVASVRFLLHHGAKPNPVSLLAYSPLVSAIFSRSSECFELLLKAGADPNTSSCGLTPLSCAAIKGDVHILRSLLSAGADPNSVSTLSDHDNHKFEGCLKPIEHAVSVGNLECAKILFPLTERIPYYPDCCVDGITNNFNTVEAKLKRKQSRNEHYKSVDQKGKDAAVRRDYSDAAKWYSEAIYVDPRDSRMRLNRSICWSKLNQPVFALYDAVACVELKPKCPKAHYRQGVAWMLLKNYIKAAVAFCEASKLDPQNREINRAWSVALESIRIERMRMYH